MKNITDSRNKYEFLSDDKLQSTVYFDFLTGHYYLDTIYKSENAQKAYNYHGYGSHVHLNENVNADEFREWAKETLEPLFQRVCDGIKQDRYYNEAAKFTEDAEEAWEDIENLLTEYPSEYPTLPDGSGKWDPNDFFTSVDYASYFGEGFGITGTTSNQQLVDIEQKIQIEAENMNAYVTDLYEFLTEIRDNAPITIDEAIIKYLNEFVLNPIHPEYHAVIIQQAPDDSKLYAVLNSEDETVIPSIRIISWDDLKDFVSEQLCNSNISELEIDNLCESVTPHVIEWHKEWEKDPEPFEFAIFNDDTEVFF